MIKNLYDNKLSGKTLIAKSIAREFDMPLWNLDVGSIFGSLVGQSEKNMRNVIKTIEALGKSVILIDEVEKSLSTTATAGGGDSGTSSRTFATLLTWMSDRETPGFIVFTSNNHLILPPELTRKGRIDEAFWVDLPSAIEREDIFKVVIKKYNRKLKDFNVHKLVGLTEDYTGAEIEEIFKNALFEAFGDDKDINDDYIIHETQRFVPNCKMFPAKIKKMRDEAKGKLRFASEEPIIEAPKVLTQKVGV